MCFASFFVSSVCVCVCGSVLLYYDKYSILNEDSMLDDNIKCVCTVKTKQIFPKQISLSVVFGAAFDLSNP